MTLSGKLKTELDRSFKLTHDLFAHLSETSLCLDLPGCKFQIFWHLFSGNSGTPLLAI